MLVIPTVLEGADTPQDLAFVDMISITERVQLKPDQVCAII